MSFQAYLDTVKAKTGKTPDDFIKLAQEKGLTKHSDLLAWLKSDFGLGHGHANAIIHVITQADAPKVSDDDALAKHFTGAKAAWRKPFDGLMKKVEAFGSDISLGVGKTYLSLLRNKKKFAVVYITTERLDVGIKLKGAPVEGRFEQAGEWNTMVTHRVRITDAKQLDADLLKWLHDAYDKA